MCGEKCKPKKNNNGISVQEATTPDTETIAAAAAVAATPPPTPVVVATALLQQHQHRSLRANKALKSVVGLKSTISAATSETIETVKTTKTPAEQAAAFQVVNGNMFNKGGAVSFSSGGSLSVGGVEQWKMIVEESFPRGGVTKWLDADNMPVTEASTCARNIDETSDYFLGAFGHASVSKNFTNIPGHTHVRITARVHFLDMWVGDLLFMKAAGGVLRWSKAHWFCTSTPEKSCQPGSIGSGALDTCLDPNFSDTMSAPIDVEFEHVGSSLDIGFEGHLTNGQVCQSSSDCKESGFDCNQGTGKCVNQKATWGIDDVRIFVR